MFSYCSNPGDFRYGSPALSASDSGIKCADRVSLLIIVMIIRSRMDAIMEASGRRWIFIRMESIQDFWQSARQADKAVEFIEQFAQRRHKDTY